MDDDHVIPEPSLRDIVELERPFHTAFVDNTDKLHRATKDLRRMEKQRAMNLELLDMLDRFITKVQEDWHAQQGISHSERLHKV